jgi:hypothetical protein
MVEKAQQNKGLRRCEDWLLQQALLPVSEHFGFSPDILYFEWYSISCGSSVRRQKNQLRLFASLQSIPQYVEVPPNIEAKRIISYFFAVLSS